MCTLLGFVSVEFGACLTPFEHFSNKHLTSRVTFIRFRPPE